jgi:hypothetical protein
MSLKSRVNDAVEFIELCPDKNTSSFSVTRGEYNELRNSDLLAGYKIAHANCEIVESDEEPELNEKRVKVIIAKANFNWLTGGCY